MKDISTQFLCLLSTKLPIIQGNTTTLRVVVKPQTSRYLLNYFIKSSLDMLIYLTTFFQPYQILSDVYLQWIFKATSIAAKAFRDPSNGSLCLAVLITDIK